MLIESSLGLHKMIVLKKVGFIFFFFSKANMSRNDFVILVIEKISLEAQEA